MISPPWTERPWKRSFGSKYISQFRRENFSKIPFELRLSQRTRGLERNMIQPKIGKSFMLPPSGMTMCGDYHLNVPKEWQNLMFWKGIGEQTFPDFLYIRKSPATTKQQMSTMSNNFIIQKPMTQFWMPHIVQSVWNCTIRIIHPKNPRQTDVFMNHALTQQHVLNIVVKKHHTHVDVPICEVLRQIPRQICCKANPMAMTCGWSWIWANYYNS